MQSVNRKEPSSALGRLFGRLMEILSEVPKVYGTTGTSSALFKAPKCAEWVMAGKGGGATRPDVHRRPAE